MSETTSSDIASQPGILGSKEKTDPLKRLKKKKIKIIKFKDFMKGKQNED